jgi:hypothetical protein
LVDPRAATRYRAGPKRFVGEAHKGSLAEHQQQQQRAGLVLVVPGPCTMFHPHHANGARMSSTELRKCANTNEEPRTVGRPKIVRAFKKISNAEKNPQEKEKKARLT